MAEVELASGVAALQRSEWNALVGEESPFLEWEWLASLEEAGTLTHESGWLPQPLVVRDGGRLIAACPLYVKGHSKGEFVFDWGWADAAERAGIRYYPKLLVGVPFTPVTGARFLVAPGEDRALWTRRISEALREFCITRELSSVHVNFCLQSELELLAASGFLPRIGIQYHWRNDGYACFDDYLARFRSKRRNQIRRERRQLDESGVRIEALAGDDIPDELFGPMFEFYLSTVESRYWGRQYLNFSFFEQVQQRFRERLVFISIPIRTAGRAPERAGDRLMDWPNAAPTAKTVSSSSGYSPATPRMPSVPNSSFFMKIVRGIHCRFTLVQIRFSLLYFGHIMQVESPWSVPWCWAPKAPETRFPRQSEPHRRGPAESCLIWTA